MVTMLPSMPPTESVSSGFFEHLEGPLQLIVQETVLPKHPDLRGDSSVNVVKYELHVVSTEGGEAVKTLGFGYLDPETGSIHALGQSNNEATVEALDGVLRDLTAQRRHYQLTRRGAPSLDFRSSRFYTPLHPKGPSN